MLLSFVCRLGVVRTAMLLFNAAGRETPQLLVWGAKQSMPQTLGVRDPASNKPAREFHGPKVVLASGNAHQMLGSAG